MKIEFIYTYASRPQSLAIHPFVNPILKDKETLFEFATCELSENEKQDLVEISCCVLIEEGHFERPKWYKESNGKLLVNNGLLS